MRWTLCPLTLLWLLPAAGCAVDVDQANSGEIEALRADLARLQAHEDIRRLFSDYGRTLDERDFEGFGRLFAQDAEFIGGNGSARGPAEIAALLKQSITRGSTEPTGPNLHVFTNEKIDVQGETATATSRGAFFVQDEARRPAALIFATYRDELVVEDGSWKFRRREIVGDIPGPPK